MKSIFDRLEQGVKLEVLDFEKQFYFWFLTQNIKGARPAEIKLNTGSFDVLYNFEGDLQRLLIGYWTLPSIMRMR